MHTLALSIFLLVLFASGQTHSANLQADLQESLTGDWTGVLEYRDYSEPATSTKREQLPTWLSISTAGTTQSWHYIYDDGPNKVVEETDIVTFDPAASTYSESDNDKPAQVFKVTGFENPVNGRGQLVLAGSGIENDKPSEVRVTLTIRRNLIEILEETRAAGSSEAFAFRHAFRFTRAQPPTVTAGRR
jgi:hypothetical protein